MLKITELPKPLSNKLQKKYWKIEEHRPQGKSFVLVYDKETQTHKQKFIYRTYINFLNTPKFDDSVKKSYMFCGDVRGEIPQVFSEIFDYALSLDPNYNQMTVNYYEDGDDFIEPHSDCTAKMIDNAKILIVNVVPKGSLPRPFVFTVKNKEPGRLIQIDDIMRTSMIENNLNIQTKNGTVIEMSREDQEIYRHEVPKTGNPSHKKITITFRQMKNND